MARSTLDTNQSRARFAHLTRVFSVVIQRYREIRCLHPLACSQFDHDAPQNRKLGFNDLEYAVDITAACESAIAGQTNKVELEDAIDRIISGDQSVSETLTRQVIRLVGAAFEKRQLEPARYLRRIRRKRGERVAE